MDFTVTKTILKFFIKEKTMTAKEMSDALLICNDLGSLTMFSHAIIQDPVKFDDVALEFIGHVLRLVEKGDPESRGLATAALRVLGNR